MPKAKKAEELRNSRPLPRRCKKCRSTLLCKFERHTRHCKDWAGWIYLNAAGEEVDVSGECPGASARIVLVAAAQPIY